jgi:hypothetical protein
MKDLQLYKRRLPMKRPEQSLSREIQAQHIRKYNTHITVVNKGVKVKPKIVPRVFPRKLEVRARVSPVRLRPRERKLTRDEERDKEAKWHFNERMDDMRVYVEHPEGLKDYLPPVEEYGLGIDAVKLGTYHDMKEPYIRYQLSWGGPSEEFRFFPDGRIEYWYLHWGYGKGFKLDDSDAGAIRTNVAYIEGVARYNFDELFAWVVNDRRSKSNPFDFEKFNEDMEKIADSSKKVNDEMQKIIDKLDKEPDKESINLGDKFRFIDTKTIEEIDKDIHSKKKRIKVNIPDMTKPENQFVAPMLLDGLKRIGTEITGKYIDSSWLVLEGPNERINRLKELLLKKGVRVK